MTNITNLLNDFLLENVLSGMFDIIYNDVFPNAEGECLISRHDPSSATETEFIDGSAVGGVQIAYYMRSGNPAKCREILSLIVNNADGLSCVDSESGTEIRFKALTLPSFISTDEKNLTVYSCEIKAEYNRK